MRNALFLTLPLMVLIIAAGHKNAAAQDDSRSRSRFTAWSDPENNDESGAAENKYPSAITETVGEDSEVRRIPVRTVSSEGDDDRVITVRIRKIGSKVSGAVKHMVRRTRNSETSELAEEYRLVDLLPVDSGKKPIIKALITHESRGDDSANIWDRNGRSVGCLQFHTTTWADMLELSGLSLRSKHIPQDENIYPASCADAITMANWMIGRDDPNDPGKDLLYRWTAARTSGLAYDRESTGSIRLGSMYRRLRLMIVPADDGPGNGRIRRAIVLRIN